MEKWKTKCHMYKPNKLHLFLFPTVRKILRLLMLLSIIHKSEHLQN